MAQELHTLDECLSLTHHHASPNTFRLMLIAGAGEDDFVYRQELIRRNLVAARQQLQKIRAKAMEINCSEVLALLDEKSVPAGHDRCE